MKHFFCTSNKIHVNDKKRKCEISLTGVVKENGGILLLFLHKGAAPSSGHFLNHDGILCITYIMYCRLCGPSESLREDSTKKKTLTHHKRGIFSLLCGGWEGGNISPLPPTAKEGFSLFCGG